MRYHYHYDHDDDDYYTTTTITTTTSFDFSMAALQYLAANLASGAATARGAQHAREAKCCCDFEESSHIPVSFVAVTGWGLRIQASPDRFEFLSGSAVYLFRANHMRKRFNLERSSLHPLSRPK